MHASSLFEERCLRELSELRQDMNRNMIIMMAGAPPGPAWRPEPREPQTIWDGTSLPSCFGDPGGSSRRPHPTTEGRFLEASNGVARAVNGP